MAKAGQVALLDTFDHARGRWGSTLREDAHKRIRHFVYAIRTAVGSPFEVTVRFERPDAAPTTQQPSSVLSPEDSCEEAPLCVITGSNKLHGEVRLKCKAPHSKAAHAGIRVKLVGVVACPMKYGKYMKHSRQLSDSEMVYGQANYPFQFDGLESILETYTGESIQVDCVFKVVVRGMGGLTQIFPLKVQCCEHTTAVERPIELSVGISNFIHVRLNFCNDECDVRGCIEGTVLFELVKVQLKSVVVDLCRREITSSVLSGQIVPRVRTLHTVCAQDSAPAEGQVVPFKLDLGPLDLTPSMSGSACAKFDVQYFVMVRLPLAKDEAHFMKKQLVRLVRRS